MSTLLAIREVKDSDKVWYSARDIHAHVESGRQFADWIKQRIIEIGAVEGVDYTVHKFVNGKATQIEYYVTPGMGQELGMLERNDKGREIRRWFIDRSDRLQEMESKPIETQLNNPAALRGILLSYTEKVLALEAQVAEQAPKVAALQRLEMADGSVCLTNAAKMLKVRPKDFFLHLQAKKWIYKRPGTSTWVAYQDRIQFGLLEMSEFTQTLPDGTEKLRVQTRLTPKGLAKLSFEFNGADQQAN